MAKRKLFVDTNQFLKIYFPHSAAARITRKAIEKEFDLTENAVVLVEIARRHLDHRHRQFINQKLGDKKYIVPSAADWHLALKLILKLRAQKPQLGLNAMRKMQMDALIVAMACSHKAVIFTADGDFTELNRLLRPLTVEIVDAAT